MSELVFCTDRSNDAHALSLQRVQSTGFEHLFVVRYDSAPPLYHHFPSELLQPLKPKRLPVGSAGTRQHRPVQRYAIARQGRMLGIDGGEIGEKPQVVAGDDGSGQALRRDAAGQYRTLLRAEPQSEQPAAQTADILGKLP